MIKRRGQMSSFQVAIHNKFATNYINLLFVYIDFFTVFEDKNPVESNDKLTASRVIYQMSKRRPRLDSYSTRRSFRSLGQSYFDRSLTLNYK